MLIFEQFVITHKINISKLSELTRNNQIWHILANFGHIWPHLAIAWQPFGDFLATSGQKYVSMLIFEPFVTTNYSNIYTYNEKIFLATFGSFWLLLAHKYDHWLANNY